ncbi:MAG: hypothetical protein AAF531_00905 [Actinomycetota bacterium]
MSLRSVHEILGWALVVANGLAGLWALAAHRFVRLRATALWVFTAVAEVLIAVQVIVGVIDMQRRDLEIAGVHLFYGFLALFTVGIVYSYRQQLDQWRYLLYGFGGLFLMGLALRSMFISPLGG